MFVTIELREIDVTLQQQETKEMITRSISVSESRCWYYFTLSNDQHCLRFSQDQQDIYLLIILEKVRKADIPGSSRMRRSLTTIASQQHGRGSST